MDKKSPLKAKAAINQEESKDSGNSTHGEVKSHTTKETPTKNEEATDSGKGSTPIASDGASAQPKSEKKKFTWSKEVPDRPRKKPGDYKDDIDVVE